jgi:hypothetical protein
VDVSNIDQRLVRCRRRDGLHHRPTWHLTVTESVALPPFSGGPICVGPKSTKTRTAVTGSLGATRLATKRGGTSAPARS